MNCFSVSGQEAQLEMGYFNSNPKIYGVVIAGMNTSNNNAMALAGITYRDWAPAI